ncbi:MAG: DUF222 domain-containing protein [Acidimicrobiales bacterium]
MDDVIEDLERAVAACMAAAERLHARHGDCALEDTVRVIGLAERGRRVLDSVLVEAVGGAERSGTARAAGWRSTTSLVEHVTTTSPGDAKRAARAGRALHALQSTAAAYRVGGLSAAQVEVMARLHANRRIRGALADAETELLGAANSLSWRAFHGMAKDWERLTDVNGSWSDTERHHANRTVSLHQDFDGSWHVRGGFGAAQGAAMAEILERFETIELHADWDHARAEHGDHASVEHLPRSAGQRRADAVWAIFNRAAASDGGGSCEPLVNIVMTLPEWQHAISQLAGDATPPPPRDRRRCSTLSGHHVHPYDALAAALCGLTRRVVLDPGGVVINLGRKTRLFTGNARQAALIADNCCAWPGCNQIGPRLQIDHRTEWQHGGPTNQANATTLCRFHNRWKTTHPHQRE